MPLRLVGLFRRRLAHRLVGLVVVAVALLVLVRQMARAAAAPAPAGPFQWPWLAPLALAGTLTYVMAAASLTAAAQLSAAFMNRVVPAGLGAMGTNVRYLERSGLARADAVAAVAMDSLAGFVVHAAALGVMVVRGRHKPALSGARPRPARRVARLGAHHHFPVRHRTGVRLQKAPRSTTRHTRRALGQIAALAQDRRRSGRLLGASAGVTAAYALGLCAAVQVSGGGVPLLSVLAVYVGGSALAAAAPTPGGLGAVEASLVAGLASAGQPVVGALTAVLVFRLVTYWLPIVPGA